MTFLHPTLFLAGLACVGIPILIHLLLRQRRRPIPWAAMRFLLEAYRKHRRRLRLEQWLLLACRCLIVLLLGAAIARPMLERLGVLGGSAGRSVYLLIDTGLASSLRMDVGVGAGSAGGESASGGGDGARSALDRHKASASAILESLQPGDRAALIALGGPAEGLVTPPSSDLSAVRNLVNELTPADGPTDLAGGLDLVALALAKDGDSGAGGGAGGRVVIAVLSDFLAGSADLSKPLPTALARLEDRGRLTLLASPALGSGGGNDAAGSGGTGGGGGRAGNVQIVEVQPLRPVLLTGAGGAALGEQVNVTLRRSGSAVAAAGTSAVRLRFVPGGAAGEGSGAAPQSSATVRWAPGQSEASLSMQVDAVTPEREPGASGGLLLAEIDRDAIAADNVFRRPLGVREALRVGIIAQRNFALDRADRLSPAEWMALALQPTNETPIDVAEIEPASLDGPTLLNLDVAAVVSPDLLKDDAWDRLGRFAAQGGMVMVTPPVDASVHVWTDGFVRGLGLEWRIAREPETGALGLDDRRPDSPVWSRIAGEIQPLARPITIQKFLPLEGDAPAGAEVLLRTSDGRAWMVAGAPGGGSSSSGAAAGESAGALTGDVGLKRGWVVYLGSALALSWTSLPAKPLMVPLMQELVRQGFGRAMGSWAGRAGRAQAAPARTVALRGLSTGTGEDSLEIGPEGLTTRAVRRAGVWQGVDAAGRVRGLVAVNADGAAGRAEAQDPSAVRSWLLAGLGGGGGEAEGGGGAGGGVGGRDGDVTFAWLEETDPGAGLARGAQPPTASMPLLLAALGLGVLELLMARWFSHAWARGDAGAAGRESAAAAA